MPRSATTILGFVLVAFSIGFNTVRYPVVWEMVNPARASESAQSSVAAQLENPESPALPPQQSVTPPTQPAKPIEVKPAAEVVDKAAVDNPVTTEAKSAKGDGATATVEEAAAVEIEARKPLVPITPVSSQNGQGNEAAGSAGIRRLPPVEPAGSSPANRDAAASHNGSTPIYPTTGIE